MHIPVSQNAFETARNFRGFANHKTRHAGFLVHMAHRHEAQYSSSSHNRKVFATVQSLLNDSRCVTPYRKALAGMRYSLELLPWRILARLPSRAWPCLAALATSSDQFPQVLYATTSYAATPYRLSATGGHTRISIMTPSHRAASDASVRLQC